MTAGTQASEKMAAMRKELEDRDKVQESAVAEAVAREREKSSEKDVLITKLKHDIQVKEKDLDNEKKSRAILSIMHSLKKNSNQKCLSN